MNQVERQVVHQSPLGTPGYSAVARLRANSQFHAGESSWGSVEDLQS